MKKLFSLLLLSLLFCSTTFGQELKDRFLISFGYGFHYFQSPNSTYIFFDEYFAPAEEKFISESFRSFSFYDYSLDCRLNLLEINKNSAISVKASPTLGLDIGTFGFLSFQLPLSLEYDLGAGSTYDATDEKGFYVSAGLTLMVNPLIYVKEREESQIVSQGGKLTKAWLRPSFGAGYRYWNNLNRMKEIGVQFAIGPKGDAIPDLPSYNGHTEKTKSSFYIGLTIKRFFNY